MMNIEEVKRFLPQRYPFLMVDRVIDVQPGETISAIKNISVNESYFNGHFPDRAVMPGVMMIEAMAQAAGILGLKSTGKESCAGQLYLLCGLSKTRFKRPVIPGDQLQLHARLLTKRRNILRFACEARVEGELAARTELMVAEQIGDDQESTT